MSGTPVTDTLPPLSGLRVLVAGAGTAGTSAALFLAARGSRVTVCDGRPEPRPTLTAGGVEVIATETAATGEVMARTDLVVVSPGFRPDSDVVTTARAAGLPVWGEVELAWHVDHSGLLGEPRTWLVITGTNGKTTTTSMVEAIVEASPRTVRACGNIGLPVLDTLVIEPRIDVLAVELSSFQLHWAPSVVPDAGAVLNIAEDHLDWHGGMAAYIEAKSGALRGPIAVIGADDPVAGTLAATAPGARTVGVRLGAPGPGEFGVLDGQLTDRAFGSGAAGPGTDLASAAAIRPAGPSGVTDALAAAALCRAIGVDAENVRHGLQGFRPGRHRGEVVATIDGIDFVDDSKATNPHAAIASIGAHRSVALIAGGLLKGASVDELVIETRDRLIAVVVIGADRDVLSAAIARHAPTIPTVTLFTGDDDRVIATPVFPDAVAGTVNPAATSDDVVHAAAAAAIAAAVRPDAPTDTADRVMSAAVATAWTFASHSSLSAASEGAATVLLAPAAASLDMFSGYGARGDAFARAAAAIGTERNAPGRTDAS